MGRYKREKCRSRMRGEVWRESESNEERGREEERVMKKEGERVL